MIFKNDLYNIPYGCIGVEPVRMVRPAVGRVSGWASAVCRFHGAIALVFKVSRHEPPVFLISTGT